MHALMMSLLLLAPAQDPVPTTQDPPVAAPAKPATEQSAVATLQGCAMEGERWVCRYQMPEIRVVEEPPRSLVTEPAPPVGEARPDVGALDAAQRGLVVRCADAGWLSLCMPGDRRRARELRDQAAAYDGKRRDVTAFLAQGRCDLAVTTALEAGHLNLAREARAFCGR